MKSIFNQILDIAVYGVEWVECLEKGTEDYENASLETTAFIISCFIVQNCNLKNGLGASEVVESLNLFSHPNKEELKKSLEELFVSLGLELFIF